MKLKRRSDPTALKKYLLRAVFVSLVPPMCLVASPLLAQAANLCKGTSKDMSESCQFAVKSDYLVAMAKCNNSPAPAEARTCRQQAKEDRKSAKEECREQLRARQEICKVLGKDAYSPAIGTDDFVDSTTINNPYFPLTPGTMYIYEGLTEKGNEHVEVYVTQNTKVVLGVTCVEVRDTVSVDGNVVEDTLDWYAQDTAGNIWYFGENAVEYQDGLVVGLGGSWIAGVDRAKPGLIMEASPRVDDLYRQEFALGEAEDMAQVVSLAESVTVPYQAGPFTNCLATKEFTALEPGAIENKFYAAGIGNIQTVDAANGYHSDLISITIP